MSERHERMRTEAQHERAHAEAGPTAPPAPKRRARGGVRVVRPAAVAGRGIIIVALVALAYLLPYAGEVPVIGPQIVTQGIDWPARCSTCPTTCCWRSA